MKRIKLTNGVRCILISLAFLLTSCSLQMLQPTPLSPPLPDPNNIFTDEQMATLNSLEQVDDYPLYTMRYVGPYPAQATSYEPADLSRPTIVPAQTSCRVTWGCSLFATLGDEEIVSSAVTLTGTSAPHCSYSPIQRMDMPLSPWWTSSTSALKVIVQGT